MFACLTVDEWPVTTRPRRRWRIVLIKGIADNQLLRPGRSARGGGSGYILSIPSAKRIKGVYAVLTALIQ